MSIESLTPSNHLILCHPLLPSVFPNIKVFSNEYEWTYEWIFRKKDLGITSDDVDVFWVGIIFFNEFILVIMGFGICNSQKLGQQMTKIY